MQRIRSNVVAPVTDKDPELFGHSVYR